MGAAGVGGCNWASIDVDHSYNSIYPCAQAQKFAPKNLAGTHRISTLLWMRVDERAVDYHQTGPKGCLEDERGREKRSSEMSVIGFFVLRETVSRRLKTSITRIGLIGLLAAL